MDRWDASANTDRTAWTIAAACRYLEVEWERLRSRTRDQETVEARQLLCYLLSRAGYTTATIARLLGRDHSTIVHAIRRVERSASLTHEGQRLVGQVVPFVREEGEQVSPGVVPTAAVSRSLLRVLLGAAPLRDVRAVRAYVCGTLLGRERVPAPQAALGPVHRRRPTARAPGRGGGARGLRAAGLSGPD